MFLTVKRSAMSSIRRPFSGFRLRGYETMERIAVMRGGEQRPRGLHERNRELMPKTELRQDIDVTTGWALSPPPSPSRIADRTAPKHGRIERLGRRNPAHSGCRGDVLRVRRHWMTFLCPAAEQVTRSPAGSCASNSPSTSKIESSMAAF